LRFAIDPEVSLSEAGGAIFDRFPFAAAFLRSAAVGAVALLLASCASSVEQRSNGPAMASSGPPLVYKIGPQDVLDISVFNVPEMNRTVQVSDVGTINFPLVGDISTSGKSAHEVEALLAARLNAKYLRSPQVTVLVKEYNSQHFTIDGAVKKAGVFPLRGPNTLLQAIALAGGLDTDLSSSDVVVFRKSDSGTTSMHYDIESIRAGQSEDPRIQDEDSIIVGSSQGKSILNDIGKVAPVFGVTRLIP